MAFSCANLSAYFSLEESTGTRVDQKSANGLTPTNVVSNAAGILGNAASFSGTSYLSRASTAALTWNGNVNFSVAFWMYVTTNSFAQALVWKGNGAGTLNAYEWRLNTNTNLIRFAVTNSIVQGVLDTTATWAMNTWNFIAAWYDGSTLKCAINNGNPASLAYTGGSWNSTEPFALGATGIGTAVINNGSRLDEVSIWNGYAFTAGDVTTLYNGGAGYGYAQICPSAGPVTAEMRGGFGRYGGLRGGFVN